MNKLSVFPSVRPPFKQRKFSNPAVETFIGEIKDRLKDPEIAWMFENCFPNTLDTTVKTLGTSARPDTFVITGDIPSMWLRDSTAQVWPYLALAREDESLRRMLRGVIRRQVQNVLLDPYANAFEENPKVKSTWESDLTAMKAGIHERKYELDSLCAVLRLATGYFAATGDRSFADKDWGRAVDLILETMEREQVAATEDTEPFYRFERTTSLATDTLPLRGRGNPGKTCGLIRSAFRPSDDATLLPFLIPANAMAVVELRKLAQFCRKLPGQKRREKRAALLAGSVDRAIRKYGTINHPVLGKIFAYEVDGFGSSYFMDDANVPSLLSLPYLGYCSPKDATYLRTRRAILSLSNPYYSKGTAASGVGGPHVGRGFVWPIAIMVQILTSQSEGEVKRCLGMLKKSHAGTGFMHESFWKDDPAKFTRPWFAWANSLFGEMVLHVLEQWPGVLAGKGGEGPSLRKIAKR